MLLLYNFFKFVLLISLNNGILCSPILHQSLPTTIQQQHTQQVLPSFTHQYGPRHRPSHSNTLTNNYSPFEAVAATINGFNYENDPENDDVVLGEQVPNGDITFGPQISDSLIDSSDQSNEVTASDESDEESAYVQGLINEIKNEEDIAVKSANLLRMLQENPSGPLPVVYVEEDEVIKETPYGLDKRSGRYYRRYPWKRQNQRFRSSSSSNGYDADSKYQCVPSREDVFKLLVGLHENRNGNQHKTVNFCNRKRPAKAIFTNIRFLG